MVVVGWGWGGGGVQGDRSVNHQWLCFILPPLSKTFKGGFVYLLRRQELGIWGTGNQAPPPSLHLNHSPSSVHPSALQHTPHIHPLLCPLFCTSPAHSPPSDCSYLYPEWACCAHSHTLAGKLDKGMLVPLPLSPYQRIWTLLFYDLTLKSKEKALRYTSASKGCHSAPV